MSYLGMNVNTGTFTIWTELEDWSRNNFLVEPQVVKGEKTFKILTESETIGILHKTFENTWEWIEGDLTLQDAERLGDEIEIYYEK